MHAAWGELCRLLGYTPGTQRERLRRHASRITRREITSCRQLTDPERRRIAADLNARIVALGDEQRKAA